MSISNPNQNLKNPAQFYLDWNGAKGHLYYYDKEAQSNVIVNSPFYFVVMDELNVITGFNKPTKSGIYSNEIRNTKTDPFRVRTFKGGNDFTGMYKEIKDRITALSGKFTKSVYAYAKINDVFCTVNIKFSGAAFAQWLDFSKKNNQSFASMGVVLKEAVEDSNGSITFLKPVFEIVNVREETIAGAVTMDKTLQMYLDSYLKRKPDDFEPTTVDYPEDHIPDDAYTDWNKSEAAKAGAEALNSSNDSVDDLPF